VEITDKKGAARAAPFLLFDDNTPAMPSF